MITKLPIKLLCLAFYLITILGVATYAEDVNTSNDHIVDGIALIVNGEPITIYEIKKAQRTLNTDKLRATDFLVMQKLKNSEIKRLNIEATDSQIDYQVSQIAQQNGMSIDKFYVAVMKEGMSITEYRSKLKEQMLTQELMRKILLSSNVGQEDELRKYYNAHKSEFVIPKEVEITKFVSNSKEELGDFVKAGDINANNDSIAKEDSTIKLESLPPQIADVVISTAEGSFTQVLNATEGNYVAFYIKKKLNTEQVEFDKVKNYIAQKLAVDNQEKLLNEYFERVRSNSKIDFIR